MLLLAVVTAAVGHPGRFVGSAACKVHWFYAPIAHHAAHTPCLPAAPTSPGRTLSGRPSLLSPGDRFSPPPIFVPPHGGNFLGSTASEAQVMFKQAGQCQDIDA